MWLRMNTSLCAWVCVEEALPLCSRKVSSLCWCCSAERRCDAGQLHIRTVTKSQVSAADRPHCELTAAALCLCRRRDRPDVAPLHGTVVSRRLKGKNSAQSPGEHLYRSAVLLHGRSPASIWAADGPAATADVWIHLDSLCVGMLIALICICAYVVAFNVILIFNFIQASLCSWFSHVEPPPHPPNSFPSLSGHAGVKVDHKETFAHYHTMELHLAIMTCILLGRVVLSEDTHSMCGCYSSKDVVRRAAACVQNLSWLQNAVYWLSVRAISVRWRSLQSFAMKSVFSHISLV